MEVGDVAEEYHPVSAGGPRAEAAILREFLSGLNEVDRSVMLLYLDGLSHDQIGDVTGATRCAIAVRLHRLRTAFVERYLED
mgnify:FL=1